jgi:hypothetical protein
MKTLPPGRRERPKAAIIRQPGFEAIHTLEEMVAEFPYRPTACNRAYRAVVLASGWRPRYHHERSRDVGRFSHPDGQRAV